MTRVCLGINPQGFAWTLRSGESFCTPEAVLVYSDSGLGAMSRTYHRLYRTRLCRGAWRDKERPVLFNSWEAAYFDFDSEKLLGFARAIKPLGAELFVLDDGWFGERDNDTRALGDWYENRRKLPEGLSGLSKAIRDMGLMFGLWIEPEMVNGDSELMLAHPDWVLCEPDRIASHGRNQYVLDLSKPEVTEYLYERFRTLLTESDIDYVKWDMNRSFSECFSQGAAKERQGETAHRYILGLYSLLERLKDSFPELLLETCASGGARFDPGMLYYSPQIWASDETDAYERIAIQYGTSIVYPLSCMGAHVSAVPNHQVKRITPLSTRANTAYFGVFGYELDPCMLTREECTQIKTQIDFYKRHRALVSSGDFYRLQSPPDSTITAWMVVQSDKKKALAAWYKGLNDVNTGYKRLRLRGLQPNALYKLSDRESIYSGGELMYAGLQIDEYCSGENNMPYAQDNCDFTSRVIVVDMIGRSLE